ncbi:PREDICTED: uncharacterized protein LOC105366035 [Ceratosolen solmsi marchali]|uniref:Uncharacterized protein LOC105366035 n=1 Tax=Ceratosolen solmsi marchali TaxID=326594 RepID=A0AAJ7E003_9HYME|nr:PREDICTED: uncharacterized protein LOC105366035 [Ceratosolen solmsi marchali]
MCKFLISTILCSLSFYIPPARSTYCWIDVNKDFNERQPLVLQSNSNEFLYPSKSFSSDLKFTFCESLRIACPQDNITVFSSKLNISEATLKCYGLLFFNVAGTGYSAPVKRISCAQPPLAEANTTSITCPNGTIAHIGFRLQNSGFLPTIDEICHNETLGQTHWAHSKVPISIRKRQRELGLPTYSTGPFYQNISMNPWIFTKQNQQSRLRTLLNSTALVDIYIPNAGDSYLVESMLVPKEDMFYQAQQRSTFFYINTVPVWKSIRDQNWNLVEQIVRKVASKQPIELDVWTGGIGNLTLNNSQGNATTITLATNGEGNDVVPVPRFLFKYVMNKIANTGIVFITVNNPHVTAITVSDILCQTYAKCAILYPQFNIAIQGYTYCCTVDSGSQFFNIADNLGLPTFPTAQPLI